MAAHYPIGRSLQQTSTLLGIKSEQVLRRVGLSPSLANLPDLTVPADMFFRLWDAVVAEAARPNVEMDLAMSYAHGPFLPPIFAFSCADTLALGLARLADFKPLIGPIQIEVMRDDLGLKVSMRPSEPHLTIPPSMALFELLYITECARCFSGTPVTPVQTSLPGPLQVDADAAGFLGQAPRATGALSLTFSHEDADRPLITRSPALWDTLEPGFQEQLQDQMGTATMAGRIKKTLAETLPGGASSVEDMAKRLNVSKRSLQRRLSEEGTSFQELLSQTRFEMSELYLDDGGLSVPEISFLLGFRDTSSFFRAFQGWTGMTPGDYRATKSAGQEAQLH